MLDFEVSGHDVHEENIATILNNLKSTLATVLEVDEDELDINLVNQIMARLSPPIEIVEIRVQVTVTNVDKKEAVLDFMNPEKFPEEMNNMIAKDPKIVNKGITVVHSNTPIVVADTG